jgi:hypothetical protein
MYSADFFKNPIQLNRPLTADEYKFQLKQKERLGEFDETLPHYELAVIQQNSTFVELTDRNYPVRGVATLLGMVGTVLFGGFLVAISTSAFMRRDISIATDQSNDLLAIVGMSLIFLPVVIACFRYILLRESFCYTHYPIRLNRKNRMVYVWRKNGQTLTVPWDKVFFCLRSYSDMGLTMWDIRGHVLDDDGVTVKDSFPLSSYKSSEANDLRQHFEYFRRYMEEGPEQPYRMLKICLPIARRRETWWEGLMRLLLNLNGSPVLQFLTLPFFLPTSLGRWFAMHTSRIPQWPAEVEKECAVESNDPYKRESGWEVSRDKANADAYES